MERLEPARRRVVFHTRSGALTVQPTEAGYVMDFPARASTAIDSPPGIADALGAVPIGVFWDGFNYLVLLDQAATVRTLTPDIAAIARIARDGMIVTAQGDRDYDFTSRYFAPSKGIAEDPVTGGAHCALAPFWAGRLGKTVFRAYQASHRGGEVICRAKGQRVELEGSCVFYLEGMVDI